MKDRILCADIGQREGKRVVLAGWVHVRRDHGKIIFIDLRDRSGLAQCVFLSNNVELFKCAGQLRSEWVVELIGEIKTRPENLINKDISSGSWEVLVSDLKVITQSETPIFDLETDGHELNEEIRLKHRYLDLRRPRLQKNLHFRHQINQFIRNYLSDKGFTEVETPIISKSTPEGARDFLVPSRKYPGQFYALPQSPQQYKQLLMVAGLERYFQIARCFRDEDTRGDRQPEFTQLDLELSFTDEEEVMGLVEDLYVKIVTQLFPNKKIQKNPFPRMTYQEAMTQYQTDRPDLRPDPNDSDELAFVFINDSFPAFEYKKGDKRWGSVHHPFTQPNVKNAAELKSQFKKDPAAITARQYDLVLNGFEIGGGSIRIHDPELLQTVFELLGNNPQDVQEQFGHLLEAFKYGVPPHGGMAMGLDRFIAIINNEPNIREVIAFPKTGDAQDLMMNSPSHVSKEQLDELGISIKKNSKKDI